MDRGALPSWTVVDTSLCGETVVVIALSAAHRRQMFDALHYAIDRLKEIVPVWKKEVNQDKSEWVNGRYRPTEKDN